jgi:glutamate/tyrosine decarboxylase-like PLP-dependent enzyme
VAQVGAINTGAVDPLVSIAEICSEKDLWFHADGACGAVGAMLPEKSALYRGLEQADSVTLDPHKWLFIPYECGCLLVKEAERLRRTFSTSAPYLQGTLPTDLSGLNYFDYGPQMSRGFDAAKVWMTLKHFGLEGYRRLLRNGIACAVKLDELVKASEDFVALHKPELFIYSFQFAPRLFRETGSPEILDRANQVLADRITESGFAFVMTTRIHGRVVLRLSICSHRTTTDDIEAVFLKLQELGKELKQELSGN